MCVWWSWVSSKRTARTRGSRTDWMHIKLYSRVECDATKVASCRACRGCTNSCVVRAMFERADRRGREVNLGVKEVFRSLASRQARRSISPRASRL